MPRPYTPARVSDWSLLERNLAEFISSGSKSSRTQATYAYGWTEWRKHCSEGGWDTDDAPFEAFLALWTRERKDGQGRLSPESVRTILSSVVHYYKAAGRTPAHKQAEHAETWSQVARGARRAHGDAQLAGRVTTTERPRPLMREALVQLLSTAPASTPASRARVLGALLALDLGVGPDEVCMWRRKDLREEGRGNGAMLAGHALPCDHLERAQGLAWDCTACAARAVALDCGDDDLLLAAWTASDNLLKAVRASFRTWSGAFPCLTLTRANQRCLRVDTSHLSQGQVARLRRAVVLSTTPDGVRWARARAWVSMSWTLGLRMCSDLSDLDRGALVEDPNGRGLRLTLGPTKDDPLGVKDVVRGLPGGTAPGTVASLVREYLAVWDARGLSGRLVARVNNGTLLAVPSWRPSSMLEAASEDLNLLCRLAGLPEGRYTSYSLRRGFAQQAAADGWPVEDIQDALRHADARTTASYLSEPAGRAAATRLMGSMS